MLGSAPSLTTSAASAASKMTSLSGTSLVPSGSKVNNNNLAPVRFLTQSASALSTASLASSSINLLQSLRSSVSGLALESFVTGRLTLATSSSRLLPAACQSYLAACDIFLQNLGRGSISASASTSNLTSTKRQLDFGDEEHLRRRGWPPIRKIVIVVVCCIVVSLLSSFGLNPTLLSFALINKLLKLKTPA